MFKEFKEFTMRGNVIDLAVGIIIGIAFGKIVASLVKDVIMPPIGLLLGNVDFSDIAVTLQTLPKPVTVNIGVFVNTIIEFVIIAFALFIVIKVMNSLKKKEEAKPEEPAPEFTKQEELLAEIRDLLKEQRR
jgi:large conductance mechanosensitive channel